MLRKTVREFQEETGWTDATALVLLCRFIEENNLESELADHLSDQVDAEVELTDEDEDEDENEDSPPW